MTQSNKTPQLTRQHFEWLTLAIARSMNNNLDYVLTSRFVLRDFIHELNKTNNRFDELKFIDTVIAERKRLDAEHTQ